MRLPKGIQGHPRRILIMKEKGKPLPGATVSNKAWLAGIILLLAAGTFLGFCLVKKNNSERPVGEQTTVPAKDWMDYKDERGFAVQIPKGWKINVTDWGLIKIGPDPEINSDQMAFVLTMIYPGNKTKEEVLAEVKGYFEKSFARFQITDQKTVDRYNSIICKIKCAESGMVGVLNVSGVGKNYFISGFSAPPDQLKDSMPNLMKILASFTYDPKLKNPDQITDLVQMVSWKDPKESAFTVDVPKGWNIEGGIVRPYIDAGLKIIATSGDKGIHIENPFPPIYTAPNPLLSFSGFTEGSHYNPSGGIAQDMIVMSEKGAEDYIKTLLAPRLNLRVDSVRWRDDLIVKTPKNPYTKRTTAAEGTLSGDGRIHKVIVVEQSTSAAGITIWTVGLTHYWAPDDEFGKVEEIATAMGKSFKIDPTWAKNEQIQIAKRSQIISQSASEISDIISSTFEYRSATQEAAADKWSNAILGVEDVYDPSTGENYTVPNTSKYYWTDGLNTVIGTETHESPGNYWDWHELVPKE